MLRRQRGLNQTTPPFLHLSICVTTYLRVPVYLYTSVCVCTYIYIHAQIYILLSCYLLSYTGIHIYTLYTYCTCTIHVMAVYYMRGIYALGTRTYTYTHVCVYTCTIVNNHMYICMCVHASKSVHTHIQVYVYVDIPPLLSCAPWALRPARARWGGPAREPRGQKPAVEAFCARMVHARGRVAPKHGPSHAQIFAVAGQPQTSEMTRWTFCGQLPGRFWTWPEDSRTREKT